MNIFSKIQKLRSGWSFFNEFISDTKRKIGRIKALKRLVFKKNKMEMVMS